MPKLPKGFGRRKSTANALEEVPISPVAPTSFRVFERPDGGGKSFDGGVKLAKNTAKANNTQRYNEDNIFEDLKGSRGSAASNSNTTSTTDNSSRLSAASTTPSSTDLPSQTEWRSPHDKPFSDIPVPPIPRTTSGFSLKAAGRTFSFGRGKSPTRSSEEPPPPVPRKDSEEENQSRSRAVTTSSYASTATPPKLEEKELGLSLGGNFTDMFSGFGKRKSAMLEVGDNGSRDSPMTPAVPALSYAGNRTNQPPPLQTGLSNDISPSPNSWSSQRSQDGLMSSSSPLHGPPIPRHGAQQVSNGVSPGMPSSRLQRPAASADSGLKRTTAIAARRQSTVEYVENGDENARLLKDAINATRQLAIDPGDTRVRDSWLVPLTTSPGPLDSLNTPSRRPTPVEYTSRTIKSDTGRDEDNMFDHQITAAADLAHRYEQRSDSPPREQTPKNKVMTPAQFEKYKRDQELFKSFGGLSKDDANDDDAYNDDDEDEAEKQKQIAKQRRKQEAHMAVYRQQMMKVTGETSNPVGLPRQSVQQPRNSINVPRIAQDGAEDEDEDEEVPLAILAAHGFPNKNRPPTQLFTSTSNPNLRASSILGAYPASTKLVAGEQLAGAQNGRLPVFARNLPDDPYFGAGLVNPINRESLALGTGAGSVYGGSTRGALPGGLVNVIATEERARAMRRGSPNANGEYSTAPSNGFNGMGTPPGMQMPPMGRSMTMPNFMGPMGPTLSPGDHAQLEMAQQMQQFMQMQMQFMQMMTNQGRPQSQSGPLPQLPPMPSMGSLGQQTPQGIRPLSSNQRTMSMLDPNAAPWQQNPRNTMYAGGYAPSIAPSERSNVGLPGRYRPVSHYIGADNKSRTATMSGALQDWNDAKQASATVKIVKKSGNASDEDDEEGWEVMKQKREKKKSIWRSKKDDSGALKDLWGFANN